MIISRRPVGPYIDTKLLKHKTDNPSYELYFLFFGSCCNPPHTTNTTPLYTVYKSYVRSRDFSRLVYCKGNVWCFYRTILTWQHLQEFVQQSGTPDILRMSILDEPDLDNRNMISCCILCKWNMKHRLLESKVDARGHTTVCDKLSSRAQVIGTPSEVLVRFEHSVGIQQVES